MPQQLRIFVSSSPEDRAFRDELVGALREAGANVCCDEDRSDAGPAEQEARETMQRLVARPVVLVLVSRAALASPRVKRECEWAYNLLTREPNRLMLLVVTAPVELRDFEARLHLAGLKRIGAGAQPIPPAEAVARTLRLLQLPSTRRPDRPRSSESLDDLLVKGLALAAQKRHAGAVAFFERVTHLAPGNVIAWANLGRSYGELGRYRESLNATEVALDLDGRQAWAWGNKGVALNRLRRYDEALVALNRALSLDPNYAYLWTSKGIALRHLQRHTEALAAYDRALALDPHNTIAWTSKGVALKNLRRYDEALAAYDQALALDPRYAVAWNNKGTILRDLKRYDEALAAYDQALALDPDYVNAWWNKGLTLERLRRYEEALAALEKGCDPNSPRDWRVRAQVLRALGRTRDAVAAERRAKALGG